MKCSSSELPLVINASQLARESFVKAGAGLRGEVLRQRNTPARRSFDATGEY